MAVKKVEKQAKQQKSVKKLQKKVVLEKRIKKTSVKDGKVLKKTKTNATKQASKARAGRGGTIPPVDKQFGKPNGNKRHNGAWKKEDTPRYKLEQMMKMSSSELKAVNNDLEAPMFERKLANAIYNGDWNAIERMINQVYGMPTQKIQNSTTDLPNNVTDEELNDAIFGNRKTK